MLEDWRTPANSGFSRSGGIVLVQVFVQLRGIL